MDFGKTRGALTHTQQALLCCRMICMIKMSRISALRLVWSFSKHTPCMEQTIYPQSLFNSSYPSDSARACPRQPSALTNPTSNPNQPNLPRLLAQFHHITPAMPTTDTGCAAQAPVPAPTHTRRGGSLARPPPALRCGWCPQPSQGRGQHSTGGIGAPDTIAGRWRPGCRYPRCAAAAGPACHQLGSPINWGLGPACHHAIRRTCTIELGGAGPGCLYPNCATLRLLAPHAPIRQPCTNWPPMHNQAPMHQVGSRAPPN